MSTAEIIFGYFAGVLHLGAFIWIGIALHFAYTKTDLMLARLKKLPCDYG